MLREGACEVPRRISRRMIRVGFPLPCAVPVGGGLRGTRDVRPVPPGRRSRQDLEGELSEAAPQQTLAQRALAVRGKAYAPYSKFLVGAAIETDRGVFEGVNVENASFGLTVCAERVAIGAAVAAGARRVYRVAVATDHDPPAPPCGACRQVIAEFGYDAEVELVNTAGEQIRIGMEALLPENFHFPEEGTQ